MDFIRSVSRAFTAGPATASLPGTLPDAPPAPQQQQHQQQPPPPPQNRNINTAEELLAATTANPDQILQVLHDQQETIRMRDEALATSEQANAEWMKKEGDIYAMEQQLQEDKASWEDSQRRRQQAPVRRPAYVFNDDQMTRKSQKWPDPDKFDGNRAELRGFVYQLKTKLRNNQDWYATELEMVAYSVGRLEKTASERILPLVESENGSTITTMPMFFKALEAACGDPDRKATAQRYIQTLKQANRSFAEFLGNFEAHIHDTGFDEDNQRFCFKEGLSSELRLLLIPTQAHTLSFDEFKALCQRMDNEQRQFKPFIAKILTIPITSGIFIAITLFISSLSRLTILAPAINKFTNDFDTIINLSIVN